VSLTIDGDRKSTTALGGFISILIGACLLVYGIDILLKKLTAPYDWVISEKESYLHGSNTEDVIPHVQNFIEAVGVEDYMTKTRNKVPIKREYGHFGIQQVTNRAESSLRPLESCESSQDETFNVSNLNFMKILCRKLGLKCKIL
jgi:hypothetical protein